MGSCLAAYNYIIKTFKETAVDLYLEQPSSVFSYIKNVDKIDSEMEEEKEYDVFLALDCSDAARLGKALKYFDTAKKTVCVEMCIRDRRDSGDFRKDFLQKCD